MAYGGDVLTLTLQHEELGSKRFYLKSGEDIKLTMPGLKVETIITTGESNKKFTKKQGEITGLVVQTTLEQYDWLNKVASSFKGVNLVVELIDGTTATGFGVIEGELSYGTLEAFTEIEKIVFDNQIKII